MRMAVFGEIEGERHRVGILETVPGREEQFSYDPSFVERFPAAPLSVALPFQGEPYSARQSATVLQEPSAGRRRAGGGGKKAGGEELVLSRGARRAGQRVHRRCGAGA